MKIYLVGMPGSGKTTLGRQLAEKLMLSFVDLDKEIERQENKSVAEIFQQNGEDYFRIQESKLLTEWAASPKSFVMATGGGAPCFYEGMQTINKTGISIFLDVPVTELLRRLHSKTDRPLLQSNDSKEKEEKLLALRERRLGCYEQARIKLHSPDVKKTLEALRLNS